MTFTRALLASAALAAALGTAAWTLAEPMHGPAGGHGRGPGGVDFAAIDTDGDGVLTRAELTARATGRIAPLDLDGDGSLDRAELVAAMPTRGGMAAIFAPDPAQAMADRILAASGATAEGRIAAAALAEAQVNRLMAALDASRDDVLSPEEAEAPMGRRGGDGRMDRRRR
jgi:hypothetical protein